MRSRIFRRRAFEEIRDAHRPSSGSKLTLLYRFARTVDGYHPSNISPILNLVMCYGIRHSCCPCWRPPRKRADMRQLFCARARQSIAHVRRRARRTLSHSEILDLFARASNINMNVVGFMQPTVIASPRARRTCSSSKA